MSLWPFSLAPTQLWENYSGVPKIIQIFISLLVRKSPSKSLGIRITLRLSTSTDAMFKSCQHYTPEISVVRNLRHFSPIRKLFELSVLLLTESSSYRGDASDIFELKVFRVIEMSLS